MAPRALRRQSEPTGADAALSNPLAIVVEGSSSCVPTLGDVSFAGDTLTVVADTLGEGLSPGAEVKFRGLTIGSVGSLETNSL